ncbi:MAG: flippase [Terriglobia bacterium]
MTFSASMVWARNWVRIAADPRALGGDLAISASGTIAFRLLSAALIFVVNLILANLLGVVDYGLFSYVFGWQCVLGQLSLLGFDRLFVRLVSQYRVQQSWGLLRGLLVWGNSVALIITLTGVAFLAMLTPWGHFDKSASWKIVTCVALFLLPQTILLRLQQSALQGMNRILAGQAPEFIVYPGLFLGLLGVTYLSGAKANLLVVLASYILATGAAATVAVILLVRSLPKAVVSAQIEFRAFDWLTAASPLLLIGGLDVLISQVDLLMIGTMQGPRQAGIYAAATRGARIIALALNSVNIAIAPTIARLYAEGNASRLQRLVTQSARVVFLAAVLAGAFMLIFGKFFLALFGMEFLPGYNALLLLCAGQLVNAALGCVGYLLMMTGHGRDAAIGLGIGVAVTVLFNLWLIPLWGIEGAAVASTLGQILWNGILAWRVWVRLKMTSTAWGTLAPGEA